MRRYTRTALVFAVFTVVSTSLVHAQATRTWVSGVGDDANPCSRTAPCKTFAGAISKTAASGEISVLDPGGFGCVTITKSITINGEGTLAGIAGGGVTSCITINDSTAQGTIFVTLRYLSMTSNSGTGTGINFIKGAGLVVEHMLISGFATGIRSALGNAGNATVTDTMIVRNTAFGARAEAGSISIEDSTFANNAVAVQPDTGATIRLSNSDFYNNGTAFSCGGGTLASAGNNRKGNNVGGPGTACAPNAVVNVQ
jgi:hypothetical protein